MKKRLMLALMLLLCAVLLASCGEKQKFDVLTAQNNGSQQTQQNMGNQAAQNQPDQAEEPVNDIDWTEAVLPERHTPTDTPAPTVRSEYAGATPVVIDPIDKPTPTAVPKLAVTYVAYDANKLGLAFQGPAGWTKDNTSSDTFIIQNPNTRIDYPATLTLHAEKVNADYSTANLESIVRGMLDSIGDADWDDYNPSQTAPRTLLGKNGVYANYDGVLADGRQVAGRVHAVCVDKKLYTIHLTAPAGQWNEYKELVYDKLRETLTIVK